MRYVATLGLLALATGVGAQIPGVKEAVQAQIPRAQALAADAELVRAVAAKNALHESLEEIKRKDEDWTADPRSPLRRALSTNPCAQRLRELLKSDPLVVEAILMDALGANVCISRETSDYWQGDEAKWKRTLGERRELFVDEPALDQSSGAYAVQISVAVRDGGAAIGALTVTLRVPRAERGGKGSF